LIENLGSNAVKYGSKTAPISLSLFREGDFILISMKNTGNAIDPSDLESIFTQYSRTTSAISGGQIGWGVGLTLVKGIAEAHGGSARVESNPEAGTTFLIRIPINLRQTT
jgi:signal transduction histidine kinase